MKVTGKEIQQLLQQTCSQEEAEFLMKYLDRHPELIEEYISLEDWNSFKANERLHPAIVNRMLASIREKTVDAPIKKSFNWRFAAIAAAVVLLLSLPAYWLLFRSQHNEPLTSNVQQNEKADSLVTIKNELPYAQSISLPDGSNVLLAPESALSYAVEFSSVNRLCYLKGEALFTVAKDEKRPFVVYSGKVSTTALGTVFSVVLDELAGTAVVKLMSGKVVVQLTDSSEQANNKPVYLLPGEELSCRYSGKLEMVKRLSVAASSANTVKVDKSKQTSKKNALSFSNIPLPDVLDAIAKQYGAVIDFQKNELNTISFSGEFSKETDRLKNILQDICLLNQLKLTTLSDLEYRISIQ